MGFEDKILAIKGNASSNRIKAIIAIFVTIPSSQEKKRSLPFPSSVAANLTMTTLKNPNKEDKRPISERVAANSPYNAGPNSLPKKRW